MHGATIKITVRNSPCLRKTVSSDDEKYTGNITAGFAGVR